MSNLNEKDNFHWNQFQGGSTIGLYGSEQGVILRDEEHIEGARITLEKADKGVPYRITCSIYGWMLHTRFFSTKSHADIAYEDMKLELSSMLLNKTRIDFSKTIQSFVQRFP